MIKKFLYFFNKHQKRSLSFLFVFMLVATILEMLGLGFIFSIVGSLGSTNENNLLVNKLNAFFELEGQEIILYLLSKCSILITDSGGLQKEAYWSNKLCFTLRNSTEWIETVESGWNTLIDVNVESLKLAYDNL